MPGRRQTSMKPDDVLGASITRREQTPMTVAGHHTVGRGFIAARSNTNWFGDITWRKPTVRGSCPVVAHSAPLILTKPPDRA